MNPDRMLAMEVPFWDYGSGPLLQIAGIVARLGTTPDVEQIRSRVERTVDWCPRMRKRVVDPGGSFKRPRWDHDPSFDFANHFKHQVLDPGSTADDFWRFFSDRYHVVHPPGRPPWEAWYVENVDGGSVVLLRAHHAMVDAISGMDWIRVLSDQCDDYDAALARVRASAAAAQAERDAPDTVDHTESGLRQRLAGFAKSGADALRRNVEAVWPQPIGERRTLCGGSLPLEKVEDIRRATGAGPNAIFQTILSMALETFVPLPDEFKVSMPMSVRHLYPALSPLDLSSRQISSPVDIPAHLDDPAERLAETERRVAKIKLDRKNFLRMAQIAAFVPRPVLMRVTKQKISTSNTVASSLPGPKQTQTIDGARVEAIHLHTGLVPHNPLGIGGVPMEGRLVVSITADPDIFPHATELPATMARALDALHTATGARVGTH